MACAALVFHHLVVSLILSSSMITIYTSRYNKPVTTHFVFMCSVILSLLMVIISLKSIKELILRILKNRVSSQNNLILKYYSNKLSIKELIVIQFFFLKWISNHKVFLGVCSSSFRYNLIDFFLLN
jgi:hypothetical protein